jgi:hypothetical protein
MNLLAGGLFSGICYRWPVLGLAALLCVAGYLYSQADQAPVEINGLAQDWSPTVAKEMPFAESAFGGAAFFAKSAARSREPLRNISNI